MPKSKLSFWMPLIGLSMFLVCAAILAAAKVRLPVSAGLILPLVIGFNTLIQAILWRKRLIARNAK